MTCGICHSSRLDGALLILRIAIGVVFILAGYEKLFGTPGMAGFIPMIASLHFPLPTAFAYAAALTEFVGGIAVLLGVGTRIFSGLIAIVMLVALLAVKKLHFPMADDVLALLCISIALMMVGPGAYALMGGSGKDGCSDCSSPAAANDKK